MKFDHLVDEEVTRQQRNTQVYSSADADPVFITVFYACVLATVLGLVLLVAVTVGIFVVKKQARKRHRHIKKDPGSLANIAMDLRDNPSLEIIVSDPQNEHTKTSDV